MHVARPRSLSVALMVSLSNHEGVPPASPSAPSPLEGEGGGSRMRGRAVTPNTTRPCAGGSPVASVALMVSLSNHEGVPPASRSTPSPLEREEPALGLDPGVAEGRMRGRAVSPSPPHPPGHSRERGNLRFPAPRPDNRDSRLRGNDPVQVAPPSPLSSPPGDPLMASLSSHEPRGRARHPLHPQLIPPPTTAC